MTKIKFAIAAGVALTFFVPAWAATDSGTRPAAPSRTDCSASTNSVQQLAEVDNTRDRNFHCLGLSHDGDTVTAIRVETHSFTSGYRRADFEQVKISEFSVATIESSHGAVLDGDQGHEAIILQGHFSPAGRADLVTRFLYNGFTGEYRSCAVRLDRAPHSGWRLVNGDDQTVSRIVVRTRQMPVFGTMGIADLEGACARAQS